MQAYSASVQSPALSLCLSRLHVLAASIRLHRYIQPNPASQRSVLSVCLSVSVCPSVRPSVCLCVIVAGARWRRCFGGK